MKHSQGESALLNKRRTIRREMCHRRIMMIQNQMKAKEEKVSLIDPALNDANSDLSEWLQQQAGSDPIDVGKRNLGKFHNSVKYTNDSLRSDMRSKFSHCRHVRILSDESTPKIHSSILCCPYQIFSHSSVH